MKIAIPFMLFAGYLQAVCLFTPPSGWQPAHPKELKNVKIGFVGPESGHIRPSIHLAEETVHCNLSEYIKAVKQIHLGQANTKWRDLGQIQMKAGTGRLTEIRNTTSCGEIVVLQAIFLQDQTAYLLTGAVSKETLPDTRKELLASFSSLNVIPDLLSAITNDEIRTKFEQVYNEIDRSKDRSADWSRFQKMIEKETADLGKYWQFLALQEGHSRIYNQTGLQ